MTSSFRIIADTSGKRLDVFLADRLSLTRTKVKALIDDGNIRINDKPARASLSIKEGMVMTGFIPEEKPLSVEPESIPLDILYEDDFLLGIDKPEGMVVHPSCGHSGGTLVNAILAYLNRGSTDYQDSARPGIVHRLDKGTTGVILIAKDPKTQETLSSLFKNREVEKTYRAIVEGTVKTSGGIIEGNIGRHPTDRKKMAVVRGKGRNATTRYTVLQHLNGFSYVEAYPKTGRTHQIRVHMAHIGHSITGDETYGRKAKRLVGRPLLHAYRITFPHPATGSVLTIEAPIPSDFEDFIEKYRLQA